MIYLIEDQKISRQHENTPVYQYSWKDQWSKLSVKLIEDDGNKHIFDIKCVGPDPDIETDTDIPMYIAMRLQKLGIRGPVEIIGR